MFLLFLKHDIEGGELLVVTAARLTGVARVGAENSLIGVVSGGLGLGGRLGNRAFDRVLRVLEESFCSDLTLRVLVRIFAACNAKRINKASLLHAKRMVLLRPMHLKHILVIHVC